MVAHFRLVRTRGSHAEPGRFAPNYQRESPCRYNVRFAMGSGFCHILLVSLYWLLYVAVAPRKGSVG